MQGLLLVMAGGAIGAGLRWQTGTLALRLSGGLSLASAVA